LIKAIDGYEYHVLDKALEECKGIDIAVKMRKKAEDLHIKLQYELQILTFLKEKHHHDNYKDIRKDVQKINDMI